MYKKGIRRREFTAMMTAIVMSLALVVVAANGLHRTNQVITELESKSLPDIRVALGLAEGVAQLAAFAPYAASVTQPSLLDEQNSRLHDRSERLLAIIKDISDTDFRAKLNTKLESVEHSALELSEITSQNLFLSEELLSQHFQLKLTSGSLSELGYSEAKQVDFLVNVLAGKEESRLNLINDWLKNINSGVAQNNSQLYRFLLTAQEIVSQKIGNDAKKQFLLISIRVQAEHLSEFVNTYVNDIQGRVLEQQQKAQELIFQVFWGMVVMMLLLILSVATNYGINIKIVQDLVNVTDDMTRLSNGDTRKVSKFRQRKDEIGDLLNAYQVFRTYTYRIQKVSTDLQQKKLLLESIFDGMHDGLSVYSKENRLLAWNKQYINSLGLSAQEIQSGMPLERVLQLIRETGGEFRDIGGNRLNIKQWIQSRHNEDRCVEWCTDDGRVFEFRSQPMGNGGFITLTQDLTYRRETEYQLQQAVKMESLGQLTGGVSHDFNNFLASILGNLQLLEMQEELCESSRKFVNRALRATESGQGLVQKLLAFSRKQELHPEVVCVEALIRESEDLLAYSVSDKIEFVFSLSSHSHFIRVDKIQLQNALLNLTINANGAIAGHGLVKISTETITIDGEKWVKVAVSDTGKGIPLAIQHRVFEAFFTTKEIGAGSGLGLSSVHGYVEQSGGQIGLESEPGKGTTIWMQWRLVKGSSPVTGLPGLACTEDQKLSGTAVLVEDDEQVAQTILDMLDTQAEHVVHFPSAEPAMEWISRNVNSVRVILSDVHLANSISGVELKKIMTKEHPELLVYLYSGMAKQTIEKQFDCVLDNYFVNKPVTLETIKSILNATYNKEGRC